MSVDFGVWKSTNIVTVALSGSSNGEVQAGI